MKPNLSCYQGNSHRLEIWDLYNKIILFTMLSGYWCWITVYYCTLMRVVTVYGHVFFGCTNFDHPKQFFGSNWQNIDTRVTKFWEYDNYHIINLWQKFEVPEVDMRADMIIFYYCSSNSLFDILAFIYYVIIKKSV